ncbi:hypothetical protein RFI_04833, partial [Reticulomyxa filosa]
IYVEMKKAISFTDGNNVRESDENIDLKTTERRVKEHLDSNGNVQRVEDDNQQFVYFLFLFLLFCDCVYTQGIKVNNENSDKGKSSSTAKQNWKAHNKGNKSNEANNQINANANKTNLDLFSVGNPTPQEIEWRKAQLTPHALVIHESRLLPALAKSLGMEDEEEANKTWTRKVSSFVKKFSRRIRTKVIGDQSFEEITDNVRVKYKEVQERIDSSQDPHLVALRNLLDRVYYYFFFCMCVFDNILYCANYVYCYNICFKMMCATLM